MPIYPVLNGEVKTKYQGSGARDQGPGVRVQDEKPNL